MDPKQQNGRPKPAGISDRRKPVAGTGAGHASFQRTLSSQPSPSAPTAPIQPAPSAPPRQAAPPVTVNGMPTTVCGKCGFAVPYMRSFEGKASSCPKCRAPIVLGRSAVRPPEPRPPAPAPAPPPLAPPPRVAATAAPPAPATPATPAAAAPVALRPGSAAHKPKPGGASLRPGSAAHKPASGAHTPASGAHTPASSTQKSGGLFGRRPHRSVSQPTEFKILSNDNQAAEPGPEADIDTAEPPAPEAAVAAAELKNPPSKRQPAASPASPISPSGPKEASDLVAPPEVPAKAESEALPQQKKPPSKRQPAADPEPKAAIAFESPKSPRKAPEKKETAGEEEHEEEDGDASPAASAPGRKKKMAVALAALILIAAAAGAAVWFKKHSSGAGATAHKGPNGSGGVLAGGGGGDDDGSSSPAMQARMAVGSAAFQKQRPRSNSNLLLAQNGAVPSGCTNPQFLNDGNSTDYDGGNGYASYTSSNPAEGPMTVTLKEPHEMTRVRFLLWDKDERTYRYILSVSPDGKTWKKIKDNSKTECRSWQELKFERQKVKAVAIKGTGGTSGDQLHVVELEGYDDGEEAAKLTPRTPPSGAIKTAVSSMKPGIWAEFFDGCDMYPSVEDTPDLALAQNNLAFGASPGPGFHNWPFCGPCGAIFSGYLKIEKQGLYTIFVQSQDGARLYLDGELLIANESSKFQEMWEQLDLGAGLHRIWIEYYARTTAMGINVSIKQKGENKEYISDKMLLFDPAEVGAGDSDGRHAPETFQPAAKSSARFLGRNDRRGGAWKKDVGHDGYVIFNKNGAGQHLVKLPPYIGAATSVGEHYVWQVGADPRGLEDPAGGAQRLCAGEYSGTEVIIDIHAARDTVNRLSLYLLDFDKLTRREKIIVMDRDTVLQENDPGDLSAGTWMQYEISGPVTIHIPNQSGPNCVVNAIFWDSDKGVQFRKPEKGPPSGELKPGVVAEYFDGVAMYPAEDDVPSFFRLEPTIFFGATPAGAGERFLRGWPLSGACAALFHGAIKVPQDGKYVFALESDDGARLYIDGEKVADNDGVHAMKEVEGAVDLKAGPHGIWVEYFNAGGQMGLNLKMKQKDGTKVPIPKEMLFHE